MSIRLLSVSTIYPGYLEQYYRRHPGVNNLSYKEHLSSIIDDSTEFFSSYLKKFRKMGLDAEGIIANDNLLRKKWLNENGIEASSGPEILMRQVEHFRPEVLWIENLALVDRAWLKEIRQKAVGIKLIIGYHCAPFNDRVLESLSEVDFIISCTPGLKESIIRLGKKAYLVYHGFDTDLINKLTSEGKNYPDDLIFSGSLFTGGNFHNERIKLINQIIEENISIGLYVNLESRTKIWAKQSIHYVSRFLTGIGAEKIVQRYAVLKNHKNEVESYSGKLISNRRDPVYGLDMLKLISGSRIVLNYHIGVAGDYAGNMRMFEVTGVGSCLLTDDKKNMGELFDQNEAVVYHTPADCIEKIKWLLNNEDKRKEIAIAGQKKTLNYHTVENRCRQIIEIIRTELKSL